MISSLDEAFSYQEQALSLGTRLAASKFPLYEGKDATGRPYQMTMANCLGGKRIIEDRRLRGNTAIMLKNMRDYFQSLSEATKTLQVGNFEKYSFPIVRAVFPNLIAHNLVSVQPMQGPTSLIFYMKFLYAITKGATIAGTDMIESPDRNYSSELVETEDAGTGTGAATNFTGNLSWLAVRPGSIIITDGTQVVTDDGNGNIVGDIGAGTNTVNYSTGAFDFDFAAAPGAGVAVTANYEHVLENTDNIPEIDLILTSTPVVARPHKLRTKWSLEAAQDLRTLHNLEAEVELVGAIANELRFETDQDVFTDLQRIAANDIATFSRTPLVGTSFTEHKLSFIDRLVETSNTIYTATQRAVGTWVVAGVNVCNIIETLPGFKPSGALSGRGVYEVGTLNGQWRIFKNSYMEDGIVDGVARLGTDRYTMGYKGDQMFETGYVWAPYQLFYTTPTVHLDDFIGRKGVATRYGKKAVDGRFYVNGSTSA